MSNRIALHSQLSWVWIPALLACTNAPAASKPGETLPWHMPDLEERAVVQKPQPQTAPAEAQTGPPLELPSDLMLNFVPIHSGKRKDGRDYQISYEASKKLLLVSSKNKDHYWTEETIDWGADRKGENADQRLRQDLLQLYGVPISKAQMKDLLDSIERLEHSPRSRPAPVAGRTPSPRPQAVCFEMGPNKKVIPCSSTNLSRQTD